MRAKDPDAPVASTEAFYRWGGSVPIMLGAAGHRNISATDTKLVDAVKAECELLRKSYKHSPFVILSSLAEGADRLVARVAMDELQAQLIAVLPMPEAEYERDFQTEESKAEFRELLTRARAVKTAAVPEGDSSWIVDGEPRNRQYARASAIVSDHAQVLFAIWDGKPARGTGGTAYQVEWFARGDAPNEYSLYRDAMSPLDPLEPGLLIRIDPVSGEVSRKKCPETDAGHEARTGSNIRQILKRTDKYNRDVLDHKAMISDGTPLVREATEETKNLTVTDLTYRASDQLSAHFAKSVRIAYGIVYALALCAVVVFNFVSNKPEAPWIYLAITGVMAMLALRILFRSIDNRFLEYRCIAEAARTLFFWRSAGVKHPLWIAFLSRQTGAMHWVRQAVRTMEFCQDCSLPIKPTPDGLRIAKTHWVDDQENWLVGKADEHRKRAKFWTWVSRLAIGASFLTAIVLALLTLITYGTGRSLWEDLVKDHYGDLWQAALGFFAGGGVAVRGYLSRRAHLELAKQYASQRFIFENASRMLDKINSDPKPEWTAPQILEKLGQEALQEQAEWLWLRHTRPFEVPT